MAKRVIAENRDAFADALSTGRDDSCGSGTNCAVGRVINALHARRYNIELAGTKVPSASVVRSAIKSILQHGDLGSIDMGIIVSFAAARAHDLLERADKQHVDNVLLKATASRPYTDWDMQGASDEDWSEYRDEVWMVMHIVYVTFDFGFRQLPPTQLESEVAYLSRALDAALLKKDHEMVGEVVDCLDVASVAHQQAEKGRRHLVK